MRIPQRDLSLALLCALFAHACSSSPTTTGAPAQETAPATFGSPEEAARAGVVAVVNGQPLYRPFYEQNLNFIRKRLSSSQRDADVERFINAKFTALDRLVDDELLFQEARREGLSFSEEDVRQELVRLAEAAGGEGKLRQTLLAQGLNWDLAVSGIQKRLSIDRYVKERIAPAADATEEEMIAYYNTHLERFSPELLVKLSQILIRCPRGVAPEHEALARRRAESILADIRRGQSFESMARDHSEHESATAGGSLGFLRRGFESPEFDAAAFSLAPGQISNVIRTDAGFHILKVTERVGGSPRDFDSVKEDCRQGVVMQEKATALEAVVDRLRASAQIETYLE